MEENRLSVLWNAYYVDRRVKQAVRSMVESADRKLVRLIRAHLPDLAPKEIAESLRRLEVRIDSPSAPLEQVSQLRKPPGSQRPPKRQRKAVTKAGPRAGGVAVTLADVIAASLLAPPVTLFRKYKGHRLEATLQPDGRVEFRGDPYDSCSTAAEYARSTVTGRRMNTNGWSFWQYLGQDGKPHLLDEIRQNFIRMKGTPEGA
jgi:hypothetical protein